MIPPRNLYYMLLYGWGHFCEGELRLVGTDESPNLPTLLAKVLNFHSHRLMRQGLDRGYVDVKEEGRSIRGRLLMGDMAKRQTLKLRGTAVCEFDELTPDILHNQVLLETITRLSTSTRVDQAIRHDLGLTASRFREVSRIRLTSDLFGRVQLSRNTSQYRLLMHICEMVFHELMPDTVGSSSRFKALADDQVRMSAVFEEFLRNFYRLELSGCSVSAEELSWNAEAKEAAHLAYIPKMRTDITIRSPGRIQIIDAKYYKDVFASSYYGGEKVRSEHLYQLSTYLAHAAKKDRELLPEGILVYPQGHRPVDLRYSLLGMPIRLATVNLAADWQVIHNRLIALVD